MYFHTIALLTVILLLFTFPVNSNNYVVYGKKDKSASNSTASSSQDNNKFVLKADKGDNTKPLKGVKIQNNEQPSSPESSSQESNAQKGSSSQTSNAEKTVATNVPSDCKKEVNKAFTVNPPYGEGYLVGCSAGYKDGTNGNPCSNAIPTNPYNENDDSFSNVNWKSGYTNGYSQGHNIAVNGDPNLDSCSEQSINAENHPFTQLLGSGSQSNNNNNEPSTTKSTNRHSVTKDRDGTITTIDSDSSGSSLESIHRPDGTAMLLVKDEQGNIISNDTTAPSGNYFETLRHANGTLAQTVIRDNKIINWTYYYAGASNRPSSNWVSYGNNLRVTTYFNPNGGLQSKVTEYPDGTTSTMKSDGTTTTDKPDGTWFITFPNKNADGSKKIYFSDGKEGLKYPDGRITFPKK